MVRSVVRRSHVRILTMPQRPTAGSVGRKTGHGWEGTYSFSHVNHVDTSRS